MNSPVKCIVLGALAVLVAPAAFAKAICRSPFYLEPQPRLTLEVINKFATPHTYERSPSEPGAFVVYPFGVENRPYRDGRMGIAVIVVENGDLGIPGLGGLLWSNVPAEVDEARTKALNRQNGKYNLVFLVAQGYSTKACPRATFTFTFDYPTGNLFAENAKVGSLNDPPK